MQKLNLSIKGQVKLITKGQSPILLNNNINASNAQQVIARALVNQQGFGMISISVYMDNALRATKNIINREVLPNNSAFNIAEFFTTFGNEFSGTYNKLVMTAETIGVFSELNLASTQTKLPNTDLDIFWQITLNIV